MDKEELDKRIRNIFKRLSAVYRVDFNGYTISEYTKAFAFEGMMVKDVECAVDICIKTSRYLPKPIDIINIFKKVNDNKDVNIGLEFASRVIRLHGRHSAKIIEQTLIKEYGDIGAQVYQNNKKLLDNDNNLSFIKTQIKDEYNSLVISTKNNEVMKIEKSKNFKRISGNGNNR